MNYIKTKDLIIKAEDVRIICINDNDGDFFILFENCDNGPWQSAAFDTLEEARAELENIHNQLKNMSNIVLARGIG